MKAWQKTDAAPGAELVTVPDPKPEANEVLLRVKRVSVCGTDLHIYRWDRWAQGRIKPPLIFGHEFVGEVVESGHLVKNRKPGDLLAVETHIACGACHLCRRGDSHVCDNVEIVGLDRQGAFAEYITVPVRNAWRVPPGLTLEQAAALEPLGNAVHTVLEGEIAGCSTVVTGCGSTRSLLHRGCSRVAAQGPSLLPTSNDYRLDLAKQCGADRVVNVTEEDWEETANEMSRGRGFDVVCEMSGHPDAIVGGMRVLRNGGRLSLLGIPLRGHPVRT